MPPKPTPDTAFDVRTTLRIDLYLELEHKRKEEHEREERLPR
jgi:hypothetical protein